jgi:hypothetical protein
MLSVKHLGISLAVVAAAAVAVVAQTIGQQEEFTAVAIQNNNLGSGADRVIIRVTRWSTEKERAQLAAALQKSPAQLLDDLQDQRSVGTIRTPDSLGYDLRYAHQEPGEDGGRRIVIATDRPISFWEARNQPRSIDYPVHGDSDRDRQERRGQGHTVVRDQGDAARQLDRARELRELADHASRRAVQDCFAVAPATADRSRKTVGLSRDAAARTWRHRQTARRARDRARGRFARRWRPGARAFLPQTRAPPRLRR